MSQRVLPAWPPRACGRLCMCVALVLTVLLVPYPAGATPSGWVRVTATGHGVRLTLSIRRRQYPRNALVRVWARMQNTTAHTVSLYDPGPQAAGKYIPQVIVLARPGGEPQPISLTDYMPYPGPPPLSIPLSAHAVHNIPETVILRGPLVRLDLTLAAGGGIPASTGPTASTPLLHVELTAPDTPAVTLHLPPAQPSADITPVGSVHGEPLAVWYINCVAPGYPNTVQQNIYWTVISSHIAPTCSSLTGWHEIAGWLNHSVVQIDWGQR